MMMAESKQTDRILLALVFAFSLLPIAVQLLFIHFYWPLVGGQFLNPIALSAYIWLVLAVVYYRRNRTRMAAGVFILFPVVFAFPIMGWLFRYAGAHHGFGH
jgi:membrane-bound acyltransferase YfiQ involved in biofilm formation